MWAKRTQVAAMSSRTAQLKTSLFDFEYILTHAAHQANLEQISQSRPYSGLGFQVKVLKTF